MTSQTAVVLGCKGQDGSLMCKSLLEKNYKVIGLIRGELEKHSNLHRLGIEKDIEVKIGDIRNFNDIHRLLENNRPKCVYNLAAQSSVGKSFINPNESIETIKIKMSNERYENGSKVFTFASGISLLLFYAFAMQCMSTLAIVKRETKTWKWPLIQLFGMTTIAYLFAFISFQLLK